MSLTIIIVDKAGEFKTLNVKNYCEEELYKKCGFKKDTNFILQTTWNVDLDNVNYNISMYGKTDGKKNFENISKFPYPINNKTFYGSCALVASSGENKINLSVELWRQLHEKIMENENSNMNSNSNISFSNSNQSSVAKSSKKEKQRKKESKENEKNKEKEDRNNDEISHVFFQELEEEPYCYSSDEENAN